jgi:xylulokinase
VGIPVVGGAGDQAAGAVGAGVVQSGLLSSAIGTSGVIFAASATPQTDPLGRVHTMCHAIPNTWCVFGCMLSAGGSLQWLRNTMFASQIAELRKQKKDLSVIYPQMIAMAQTVATGSENLFFLPYLTGERCPHPDPHARGCFIGLTPRHSMAHLIRATLEGITMGMREQVGIMREMGIAVTQVRAGGGGSRSDFWRQLQADMYQAPVVTINVSEGAALGAAILAGVGHGEWNTVVEATSAIIKIKTRSRPDARRAAIYEGHYRKFALLYPALRDSFAAIR